MTRRLAVAALGAALFGWAPAGRVREAAAQAASVVTPSVSFRDAAGRSSFSYVSNNDFRERKYFPQPMGKSSINQSGPTTLVIGGE